MNLTGCASLRLGPVSATWYRALQLAHVATVLSTSHTRTVLTDLRQVIWVFIQNLSHSLSHEQESDNRIKEQLGRLEVLAQGTATGELKREVYAVGVPMRRTVDGEIVAFNCGVPAFMAKKGQLEDDLGPRLVAMVRNIEASLGLH